MRIAVVFALCSVAHFAFGQSKCANQVFDCSHDAQYDSRSLVLTEPIDVLVSSPGGVGSTTIIRVVEQIGLTAFESDWTKHPLSPPNRQKSEIAKAVYCYRDVLSSVFSLLRRDYFNGQIHWLTEGRCRSATAFTDKILERCISKNQHVILHQAQFEHWLTDTVAYDRLFLNTTALYAGNAAVASGLCAFITNTRRRECLQLLRKETKFGGKHQYANISTRYPNIAATYKQFNAFLHFLPPLFVIPGTKYAQ